MLNNCEPAVVLEFYCLFFWTSWGAGVLNSAIFNIFHIRVEFGTILEGLRNFRRGVGGEHTPPRRTPAMSFLQQTSKTNQFWLRHITQAWVMHIFSIISIILLPKFLLLPLFAFRRSCNPSIGERILTKVRVNSNPPYPHTLNSLVLQCSKHAMFAFCRTLLLQLRGKRQTRGSFCVQYSTVLYSTWQALHCVQYSTIHGRHFTVYSTIHGRHFTVYSTINGRHFTVYSTINGRHFTVYSNTHGRHFTVYSNTHGRHFTVCIHGDKKRKINIFGGDTVSQCQKKKVHMNMGVSTSDWLARKSCLNLHIHNHC